MWLRLVLCGCASMGSAGCSMSIPIAGFVSDPVVTGSTDRSDALLFKALDQEDWRRAKAAMAVALDPQGSGSKVAWENPDSGAKGSFVAAAAPVPQADTICRAFRAHIQPDTRTDRDINGSACRVSGSEWSVRDAEVASAKR